MWDSRRTIFACFNTIVGLLFVVGIGITLYFFHLLIWKRGLLQTTTTDLCCPLSRCFSSLLPRFLLSLSLSLPLCGVGILLIRCYCFFFFLCAVAYQFFFFSPLLFPPLSIYYFFYHLPPTTTRLDVSRLYLTYCNDRIIYNGKRRR